MTMGRKYIFDDALADHLVKLPAAAAGGIVRHIIRYARGEVESESRYHMFEGMLTLEEKTGKKVSRNRYGQYNNVLLSVEEFEKLKTEFPADYKERIEQLSEYMASTGKPYKSHLATIRAWARRDRKKEKPKTSGSFDTDSFFEAAVARTYGNNDKKE